MKLRFTPRAVQDLTDLAAYIRERNPQAALRVRAAILETLRHLASFPHVGRRQRVGNARRLVTRRYRYLVYYTVDDVAQEIVIVTIQHPSRERMEFEA